MTRRGFGRRGAIYAAILVIAMIVATLGLSGIALSRIQLRSATEAPDVAQARFVARSAVELGLMRVLADPDWRNTYTHDQWVNEYSKIRQTISWKLVDEVNGDLTTDPAAPVRLHGRAAVGEAVRVYSIELESGESKAPSNLLTNGDMEQGVSGWSGKFATIAADLVAPHGGLESIIAENRDYSSGGPAQDVQSVIASGTTYMIDIWVKMSTSTQTVRVTLWVAGASGGSSSVVSASVGTSWTRITGEVTPNWTGSLTLGNLEVSTSSSLQDFNIDDAVFSEKGATASTVTVVPYTWRREMDS